MKTVAHIVPGRMWMASADPDAGSDLVAEDERDSSLSRPRRGPSKLLLWLAFAALVVLFGLLSGRLLVRDNPQKSDVIVVLAGDSFDERYRHGMELLRAGYGKHMFIDINSEHHYFGRRETDYAAEFLERDTGDMRPFVSVCPFAEDSTVSESRYVAACLEPVLPRKVLLVTSDFHTARALSVFRHRLPQYEWSVAAAKDPDMFGVKWWQRREWAKTTLLEWLKVGWWNVVDRWRT
jgi:uncharacterized SAM-binding protein YcdF (DUF218 family)